MNSSIELSSSRNPDSKQNLHKLLKSVEKNLESAVRTSLTDGSFSNTIHPKEMAERLFALAFTAEEMGKIGKSKTFLRNLMNATLKDLDIQL